MKQIFFLLLCGVISVSAQTQTPLRIGKTTLPNTHKLAFDSFTGRTYFIQESGDLKTWNYFPEVMAGVGGEDWLGVSSTAGKRFFRLKRSELPTADPMTADHDADGIPSFAELTVTHSDPLKFSTANNGVSDRGLFPNPSSGIYIDSANGIQYSLVTNAPGVTGPKRIVAVEHFEAPDYAIQFKKGQLALEKHGYPPFVIDATNEKTRYLTTHQAAGATDLNGIRIPSEVWQTGWTSEFNHQRVVFMTSDNRRKNTRNPLTGEETIGTGYIPTYFDGPPWSWTNPTRRGRWYNSNTSYRYDIPPYNLWWDAPAYLFYEEYFADENTIQKVGETARANPPAYPSTWTEGNPWAMWDEWSTQMGVTYSRFKFRIKNKNGITNGEPAKAYIFFDPKAGGPREEVLAVQWNGQGEYSPEYTVNPGTLKPGVEGIFHTSLGSVFFELDIAQADNRKAGGKVVIPLGDSSYSAEAAEAEGGMSLTTTSTSGGGPLPEVKFPGMDDTWYEDATITLSQTSGTGSASFFAVHPLTGERFPVPFGVNLADDFFHSRGQYQGCGWEIEGVAPGSVTIALTYQKGTTQLSVGRTAEILPLRVVSRDRFLAGSLDLPSGWDGLSLRIINTTTGEDLGSFGSLLGGGSTKIYSSETEILQDADNSSGSARVWFVRNSADPRRIDFHTCFNGTGNVEIRLTLGGQSLGTFKHSLVSDYEFAAIINYVDDWITGQAFATEDPPAALMAAGAGDLHPLIAPCVAPFFYVLSHVENLTPLVIGLCDGIVAGAKDDYALLELLHEAGLTCQAWAWAHAHIELNAWMSNPAQRAKDLKQLLDQLCQDFVFTPAGELADDLGTWQGFRDRALGAWDAIRKANHVMTYVIPHAAWNTIFNGISEWAEDFGGRMLDGAEKAHWTNLPWFQGRFITPRSPTEIQLSNYTFGYSFGYVGEQVAVGVLSAGTLKITQIFKVAANHAAALVGIRRFPVIFRAHLVKQWAADVAMTAEAKEAMEFSLSQTVRTPMSAANRKSVAEVMEETFARVGFNRAETGMKQLLEEMLKQPRLSVLMKLPGFESRFFHATAEMTDKMGGALTAKGLKNWPKLAETLCPINESGLVDDLFRSDDLFAALKLDTPEGKQVLNEFLESLDGKTAQQILNGVPLPASIKEIHSTMYHYGDDNILSFLQKNSDGTITLPARPDGNVTYWTPSLISDNSDAMSILQLTGNPRRYRIEHVVIAQNPIFTIPFAVNQTAGASRPWLEFIIRDNPPGVGGVPQMVSKFDAQVRVWDRQLHKYLSPNDF